MTDEKIYIEVPGAVLFLVWLIWSWFLGVVVWAWSKRNDSR